MPTVPSILVHPVTTEVRNRQYQFTPKHHGAGPNAAQWLPSLTYAEEFAVFNVADRHELSDRREWLYGLQPLGDALQDLGTFEEQIAELPLAPAGQPWHGYPIWPLSKIAPAGRRGEKSRPGREVFDKMEKASLLTARQRKRLFKGEHV